MRVIKEPSSAIGTIIRERYPFRQRALLGGLVLSLLAGCGSAPSVPLGTPGHVSGFAGMVAAEEPRAALVARDVLSSGGSAADAAAALGLALSVTLPSAAGLGGGGACIVYDSAGNKAEMIEFLPAGGVPGLPRGLFALQARYGKLRWEAVVTPAENLARFGTPASRALLVDADTAPLRSDAAALVAGLREGAPFTQPALAGTLGRIRVKGPGDLYMADPADTARAITAAGGRANADMLRGFVAGWLAPASRKVGDDTAFLPPRTDAAAPAAAQTGFVVLDSDGDLVACGLTMGRPFGTGGMIAGTGVLAADLGGAAPPPLAVMANLNAKEPRLAVAASGARAAEAIDAALAARAQYTPRPLSDLLVAGTGMNAIACVSGRAALKRCEVATDPGGSGLAVSVGGD